MILCGAWRYDILRGQKDRKDNEHNVITLKRNTRTKYRNAQPAWICLLNTPDFLPQRVRSCRRLAGYALPALAANRVFVNRPLGTRNNRHITSFSKQPTKETMFTSMTTISDGESHFTQKLLNNTQLMVRPIALAEMYKQTRVQFGSGSATLA